MAALNDTIKQMGGAKVAVLAASGIIMLAFFLMLGFRTSVARMVPLYSDLSLKDSQKIVSQLEGAGIAYELGANGSQISVPSDKALRLRMDMAGQGLPSNGSIVGYEIFDKPESFGSSNFVMNVNAMRALEGELSRTIASISGMDSARVHLVVPKREVFTRDKDKPSASVTVKMAGGKTLERGEVTAITHLIASAVPGLEASRVAVIDNHGRLLARGNGDGGLDAAADSMLEYRVSYETRTQQNLEELLEKVIGAGKVRVTVNADINFDRIVTNSEKFDPEGQVARSTQSNSQKEKEMEKSGGGAVSAANNLPQNAAGGDGSGGNDRTVEKADETTNFEISKTTQNQVSEGGKLNKISVGVLVDGVYKQSGSGDPEYSARPDDELAKIKSLVASSIGFDEARGDKIEVVNMRFTQDKFELAEESFFERFKIEIQGILQTLIFAGVAVLAIVLVIRPAVTQIMKGAQVTADRANELAALENASMARLSGGGGGGGMGGDIEDEADSLIDVANVKGGMKSSSMRKVSEIVDKYPEETMGVIRQWLTKAS
ncbi:MAG: flagellar basal-body MS-ring/collar protein FliF [Alphaproteobacteria bacterium]|nr:flagellar basal-body MS-ring/collar protein FliF [Alphaproteobacteria bacterium]